MIVTVTLNPALDKTGRLDHLSPGGLNRLTDITWDAGGKGINVSATIAALGGTSVATGFVGGWTGDELVRRVDALGLTSDFVEVEEDTRVNVKVIDGDSRLTELNEPGPDISAHEFSRLTGKLTNYADQGALIVFAGSLARGLADNLYAVWVQMYKARGARVFLDADRQPLRLALEHKPDLIKPNAHELAELFGRDELTDLADIAELARRLVDDGIGQVIVSLGKDGALFCDRDHTLKADALDVEVRSTVGAGDSMVAAMAYAAEQQMSFTEAATLAMATSNATVTTAGTRPPSRQLIDELQAQVRLRSLA
jgi:1-phosphofructokinase